MVIQNPKNLEMGRSLTVSAICEPETWGTVLSEWILYTIVTQRTNCPRWSIQCCIVIAVIVGQWAALAPISEHKNAEAPCVWPLGRWLPCACNWSDFLSPPVKWCPQFKSGYKLKYTLVAGGECSIWHSYAIGTPVFCWACVAVRNFTGIQYMNIMGW